jgi:hypothetical protein
MKVLEALLITAGWLHFAILMASALTPRVLDWGTNLASLPPLLRRLFWVYGGFIVLVIIGFGTLTLLYAPLMAAGEPMARALCGFIAFFWLARLAVQFWVFDARPFLTTSLLRVGYHALTLAFAYMAAVYGAAVFLAKP